MTQCAGLPKPVGYGETLHGQALQGEGVCPRLNIFSLTRSQVQPFVDTTLGGSRVRSSVEEEDKTEVQAPELKDTEAVERYLTVLDSAYRVCPIVTPTNTAPQHSARALNAHTLICTWTYTSR